MRLSLIVVYAFLLLAPSAAAAQGGPATRYLRTQHEHVDHIMARAATTDAARTARDAEVTAILVDLLDFDEWDYNNLANTSELCIVHSVSASSGY